ncbi:MAG: hypothetical protein QXS63_04535, partial [Zestosphaera sp.]
LLLLTLLTLILLLGFISSSVIAVREDSYKKFLNVYSGTVNLVLRSIDVSQYVTSLNEAQQLLKLSVFWEVVELMSRVKSGLSLKQG